MKQLFTLFKKVGGKNLLVQYWRSHVLFLFFRSIFLLGLSRKSLEITRLVICNKRLQRMRKKYSNYIQNQKTVYDHENVRIKSNKVWILWLQGIKSAPKIVQECYQSLVNNLKDREIILLTEENYKKFVDFPKHIQEKIDSKIITRTHFSDLLRLELLTKYGGTWIDATVYCSGRDYPKCLFDSDLFVYQCLKPGLDGHATSISSWFMTSCTNNPIIMLTRDLLYKYWSNNNNMIDYFLLHDFFQLAIEAFPEEWNVVPPFSNSTPHILLLRLFDKYNPDMWQLICKQTCFHKLSYKFESSLLMKNDTYYSALFEEKSNSDL